MKKNSKQEKVFNIKDIENTIIEGDTIENLKKIPDESIAAFLTVQSSDKAFHLPSYSNYKRFQKLVHFHPTV